MDISGKADTRECFNLTLGSGQLKDVSNGIMNIKITDGAGYNVNVFRKAVQLKPCDLIFNSSYQTAAYLGFA